MKDFFKRYWYIILMTLVINLPILILGCVRTNQTVTLKGDTTIVENFVEIDHANPQAGSFSTIYVISMDHSTMLQTLILQASKTSEVEDMPSHYLHFTREELVKMGRIQHESSIIYSLMLAYEAAGLIDERIHLESSFDAYVIAYYDSVSEFRIGDRIIGINGIMAKDDFQAFREAFNNAKENDVYQVERGNTRIEIKNTKENMRISGYGYYSLEETTAFPTYKIKETNVGGPSGGLLQTLALYNALIAEDITHGKKIAGTGTISPDGTVGRIGGIQQKIYTAFDDDIEIFLCPKDNYEEALLAYNTLPNKESMKLYSIETFADALEVLNNA